VIHAGDIHVFAQLSVLLAVTKRKTRWQPTSQGVSISAEAELASQATSRLAQPQVPENKCTLLYAAKIAWSFFFMEYYCDHS
jgi:hypothetical protein